MGAALFFLGMSSSAVFSSADGGIVHGIGFGRKNLPFRQIPPFRVREDLGHILQKEGHLIGAELGVQRGVFARNILKRWARNQEYHLIDIWEQQSNYNDIANVAQAEQDVIYIEAMQNVKEYQEQVRVCRNWTT